MKQYRTVRFRRSAEGPGGSDFDWMTWFHLRIPLPTSGGVVSFVTAQSVLNSDSGIFTETFAGPAPCCWATSSTLDISSRCAC